MLWRGGGRALVKEFGRPSTIWSELFHGDIPHSGVLQDLIYDHDVCGRSYATHFCMSHLTHPDMLNPSSTSGSKALEG